MSVSARRNLALRLQSLDYLRAATAVLFLQHRSVKLDLYVCWGEIYEPCLLIQNLLHVVAREMRCCCYSVHGRNLLACCQFHSVVSENAHLFLYLLYDL